MRLDAVRHVHLQPMRLRADERVGQLPVGRLQRKLDLLQARPDLSFASRASVRPMPEVIRLV